MPASCRPLGPRFRWLATGALLWAGSCASLTAEEPRLAPIQASAGHDDRVDPMRPARLSAAERERLYAQAARDAEHLEQQGRQLRRLAQLVKPTVVHINARKPLLKPRSGKTTEEETGSGVICEIAGRTVVLTNRHVVVRSELDAIGIVLANGRELHPRRLWSDAGTDLAVMEVEGDDLETARLAETDDIDIGDTVIAIGSTEVGCGLTMTALPVARLAIIEGHAFQVAKVAQLKHTATPRGVARQVLSSAMRVLPNERSHRAFGVTASSAMRACTRASIARSSAFTPLPA